MWECQKNIGHSDKFEYQMKMDTSPKYGMGYTHTKTLLIMYMKFKFNWASYILFVKSGPPYHMWGISYSNVNEKI